MNNVKLTIHLRNGEFYDITDAVPFVRISGSKNSVARTLETELLNSVTDAQIKQIQLQTGSSMCFYVDGKEIYRGNVVDLEKNTGNGRTQLTVKDLGFSLSGTKLSKNFVNVKAEDVAKQLIKEIRLPAGNFEKTNVKLTRYFRNETVYDMIMTLYTLASKKTKKQYTLDIDLNKINVVERGKALTIEFTDDSNITSATHSENIENIVNTVFVYDKDGNKISQHESKEMWKIYNRMMSEVIEVDDGKSVNKSLVEENYHGEDDTCKLQGFGDYTCKTGKKVNVVDKKTGLIGEFYIDADTHEWSGGNYKVELDLNFKNIMDAKESGSETLEKKEVADSGVSGTSTKDWGHGINASQLNKVLKGKLAGKGDTIIKYCNMYKVNPAIITAICCNECAYGTSNLANRNNNFFGMRNRNGWMKFNSIDEGIKRGISNISRNYINKGLNTYNKMVGKYAENGKSWVPTNESITRKITGKSSTQLNFGAGVKSDAEAEKNVVVAPTNYGNVSWNGMRFENEKQRIIVQSALSCVGKGQYTWGGSNRPFRTDCSGFVYWCHQQAGIKIGTCTKAQLNNGKAVSWDNLKAGDFIIHRSGASGSGRHVVLCVGNGYMVHNGGGRGRPITKNKLRAPNTITIRRCW